MNSLKCCISVFLLLLPIYSISQSSDLAQTTFVPAVFENSPFSLQNRIGFPNVVGDVDITIRCVTTVGESGSMGEPSCIAAGSGNENAFLQEVVRSSRISKVSPARVNGSVVRVNMFQYMVNFKRENNKESIAVFPNHGRNENEYGREYVAAQRYGIVPAGRCGSIRVNIVAHRVLSR